MVDDIIVGVCHAAPFVKERLVASPFIPFVSNNLDKRTNPALSFPGVESIIVVGVGQGDSPPENAKFTAVLSSLGTENDYHTRVKKVLHDLTLEIKSSYGEFKYRAFVDSPGLDERALSVRAGLGFFGKNGLIISKEFGSRFNIGYMLTDIPLAVAASIISLRKLEAGNCPSDCNLCIKSCPNGALGGDYLNTTRCISYLTQKEELAPAEAKQIGSQLYGCDICQDVCPFNPPRRQTYVNPKDWLDKTDKEFAAEYGKTAMFWRGAEILRRNAGAVIKNTYTSLDAEQ